MGSRPPIAVRGIDGGVVWVHTVALDVPPSEVRLLGALLSADERHRAASYRFAVDRDRFVVGRARLRQLLADYGVGAAERLELCLERYGKPRLAASTRLRFSVSHSGGTGLVAIAFGREVGVDLEINRPLRDALGVARHWFTRAEAVAIAACAGTERLAAFYRCWVRKEACIKACGLGLHQELDAFEVGVQPSSDSRLVRLPATDGAGYWRVIDLDAEPPMIAAMAVEVVAPGAPD